MVQDRFIHTKYLIRRKIFKIFGAAFHIYDPNGQLAFYSKQKAFKLKEDIRIYTGEDMRTEVLVIKARNIIDFSAAYDVFDPASNEKVGVLKRKGFKSMLQDEWIIMDAFDREIGWLKKIVPRSPSSGVLLPILSRKPFTAKFTGSKCANLGKISTRLS